MHLTPGLIMGLIMTLPTPISITAFRVYKRAFYLRDRHTALTYFGAKIVCNPRDFLQMIILHFGAWEPEVSHVIEQNLKPGDTFVDIGANIGYDTLLGAMKVGPKGRVIAIEALPSTFKVLQENLHLNDRAARNVRAVNVAVSDKPRTLDLYEVTTVDIGSTTVLPNRGGKPTASIAALPLLDILTAEETSRVRLIKMDVEGAELPILRDILSQIERFSPQMDILVEAAPNEDRSGWTAFFNAARESGFSAWAIENEYDDSWYLKWRGPKSLMKLDRMPDVQTDIFFTRRPSL